MKLGAIGGYLEQGDGAEEKGTGTFCAKHPKGGQRPKVGRGKRCLSPLPGAAARRHPISRWYACPAAAWLAGRLAPTRVRPVHLTACGLVAGLAAAGMLVARPDLAPLAALPVWAAWFFDRADGELARRQNTASPWGAWLDANVDELLDVAWHAAVAWAAAWQAGANWPWLLLAAFLAGKYLFLHGLASESDHSLSLWERAGVRGFGCAKDAKDRPIPAPSPPTPLPPGERGGVGIATTGTWLRILWHLPGDADVRIHLLLAALLSGCLGLELGLVAAYYHLRWIVRYALVARRLGGVP